jgi:hypothetical protein
MVFGAYFFKNNHKYLFYYLLNYGSIVTIIVNLRAEKSTQIWSYGK